METCEFEGCERKRYGRKPICNSHYQQQRKGRPLTPITRRQDGARGVCDVEDCGRKRYGRGLCIAHLRMQKAGKPLRPVRDVKEWPDGTVRPGSNGYMRIRMRNHPNVTKNGWLGLHTYVMSESLGRALLPGESVHHKNGNRADNRLENLELWVTFQPWGQRPEDLVAYAREILARYA